jgi:hypothetical protein
MVLNPVGLRTKNNCAGEGQQQFSSQSVNELVVSELPSSEDVSTKAEEPPQLAAIT